MTVLRFFFGFFVLLLLHSFKKIPKTTSQEQSTQYPQARVCVPPGNYRGKAGEEVFDDDDDDENVAPELPPVRVDGPLELTPVIDLPAGSVQGLRTADLDTFYGLPFAAAPVGDLRWSPPSQLASWGTMVFNATTAGARMCE